MYFITDNHIVDDLSVEFWNRTKLLIKQQNTTQEFIAKQVGVTLGVFQGWIYNKRFPNAYQAVLIASALGVTVEYLVTGKDSNPYKEQLDKLKASIIPILTEPPADKK
jgi:Helix-turn-helix.